MEKHKFLSREEKVKSWGEGEWCDEDDYLEFEHLGVNCKIVRIMTLDETKGISALGGHLCGYCEIPKDHPLFKKTDSYPDFDVHGGITFNELFEGEHWIGFDCSHFDDVVPGLKKYMSEIKEKLFEYAVDCESSYKNISFVMGEVKALADIIKKSLPSVV